MLDSWAVLPHLTGKDLTVQVSLPLDRSTAGDRSLRTAPASPSTAATAIAALGLEGERESLETVAERHVKILSEPSLQLSR